MKSTLCECSNPKPLGAESCQHCADLTAAVARRNQKRRAKYVEGSLLVEVSRACDDFMIRRGLKPVTLHLPEF